MEREGSRRSGFEVGYRDMETPMRLLHRLPTAARYRSDHCEAYSLLPSVRPVNGKESETNRNEGLRSKLRVKLNRLVRRTHGYGKRLYNAGRTACDVAALGRSISTPARVRNTQALNPIRPREKRYTNKTR